MGKDRIAQHTLAYWHLAGIATSKSCEESVWYYRQVADKGLHIGFDYFSQLIYSIVVIDKYKSGPPGGLSNPPLKQRLPDMEGGVYGSGVSGRGGPSASDESAKRSQEFIKEYYQIQAEEGEHLKQVYILYIHNSL